MTHKAHPVSATVQPATRQRSAAADRSSARTGPRAINDLQRRAGNRVMHRLASRIQPKLTVNRPDDEYEREADCVADEVMRMPSPPTEIRRKVVATVQRKCAPCEAASIERDFSEQVSRICAARAVHEHEEEEEAPVQAKRDGGRAETEAGADVAAYLQSVSGGGRPLDPAMRSDLEAQFGHNF
jgi:hypothetical protein